MVVRTLGCGNSVEGLYIGTRNARRHFSLLSRHIELQLGHLQVNCELPSDFWSGRPEIRDPRLAGWLFYRIFHGNICHAPVPVAMEHRGNGIFHVLGHMERKWRDK
jgi:hypothetical protein